MIDHALTQMDSDEEDSLDEDDPLDDDTAVGGACFHIFIERDPENPRRKVVSSKRLNSRKKAHNLQIDLPTTILHYFKTVGLLDEIFELRTEAMIEGSRYRAHPNYRGEGPWYDFAAVEFQLEEDLDCHIFDNDNNQFPAKLLGFYRLTTMEGEEENEFFVLAHCVQYQTLDSEIYSRRSMLQRSWLYEVTSGRTPRPSYRTAGSVKSNICVKGHIFAIEENPGFHERCNGDVDIQILVLSDARKDWPLVFIDSSLKEDSSGSAGSTSEDDNLA